MATRTITAIAERPVRRAGPWALCAAAALSCSALLVHAQAPQPAPAQGEPAVVEPQPEHAPVRARATGWRLEPRLRLAETYSDNVGLEPDAVKESGWVTQLTPGVHFEGIGPRVQAFLDYQRDQYRYHGRPELDTGQNALNSGATVETIRDWFFVEARARVLQLNTSPFGPATSETGGSTVNRTETSVVQISPYIRGALGRQALYQVRFNAAESRASHDAVPDTVNEEWVGRLTNAPGFSAFGWALDANRLVVRNTTLGELEDERLRGSLLYALSGDLRLSLYSGTESSDFTGTRERRTTPGAGLEWSPGPRTQVAGLVERRFFGTGHSLFASHRTPRAAFRYSEQKDIATLPGRLAADSQSSVYGLMSDLLAASTPDPKQRAEAVRSRLDSTGAIQYAPANAGFLTSGVTIAQRREASFTMLGQRNTVAFVGTQSEFERLGSGTLGLVETTATRALRQWSFGASWSYRLYARSTVTLADGHRRARDLESGATSRQHSMTASLLSSVGRRVVLSLTVRRVIFESQLAAGYTENAAALAAAIRF